MSKTKTFYLTINESGSFVETNIFSVKATDEEEAEKIFFSAMGYWVWDERTKLVETVDLDLVCDEREIIEINEMNDEPKKDDQKDMDFIQRQLDLGIE